VELILRLKGPARLAGTNRGFSLG